MNDILITPLKNMMKDDFNEDSFVSIYVTL